MRVPATWSFEDVTGVHYFNHDLLQNLFSILASFDVRSISQYDMDVLALWLLVSNFTPAVSTIWMSLSFFYIITNIQHSSTYTGIWYDLKDLLKHGNFYLNQEFLLAEVMLWACTERLFSRLQVSLTKISRNTQDQRHHFLIGVVSYWTSTDSSLKWRHKEWTPRRATARYALIMIELINFNSNFRIRIQLRRLTAIYEAEENTQPGCSLTAVAIFTIGLTSFFASTSSEQILLFFAINIRFRTQNRLCVATANIIMYETRRWVPACSGCSCAIVGLRVVFWIILLFFASTTLLWMITTIRIYSVSWLCK